MAIRVEKGDLFESGLPALAHGCNTQGAMGAGIATEFRRRWPDMYMEYQRRCRDGTFTLGDVFVWESTPIVFNLGTQPRPGPSATIDAIRTATTAMLDIARKRGVDAIGLPRIGAGLGGLDWQDVRDALDTASRDSQVQLVVYEL